MKNTSDYLMLGLLLICMRLDKKVCYKVLDNTIELGEKIRIHKDEAGCDIWETAAYNLVRVYTNEHEFDQAELLIKECEKENNKNHIWIEELKEFLKNMRNEDN